MNFAGVRILDLSMVHFFVLDEADELVNDASFSRSVLRLYNACPSHGSGQHRLQVRGALYVCGLVHVIIPLTCAR